MKLNCMHFEKNIEMIKDLCFSHESVADAIFRINSDITGPVAAVIDSGNIEAVKRNRIADSSVTTSKLS